MSVCRAACIDTILRRFPSDGLLVEAWADEEEHLRGADRWKRFSTVSDATHLYRSFREFAVEQYHV